MQVFSSITTSPPDPIIAPAFLRESKSSGKSRSAFVKHPPEGPPICTALNSVPPLIPPPISKITSLKVVPIGTSINPVFSMFPVIAKAFVPGLFSVPIVLYHSAPLAIIGGTLAKVSTLLSTVGLPKSPCSTVLGGFPLGIPLFPSIEAVRALPSPHTKAPAPLLILISKLKFVPSMLSPKSP